MLEHMLFFQKAQAHVLCGNLLQFAIENGPVEIVNLPIQHGGSFQFAM